jgi:hypothetical protein
MGQATANRATAIRVDTVTNRTASAGLHRDGTSDVVGDGRMEQHAPTGPS